MCSVDSGLSGENEKENVLDDPFHVFVIYMYVHIRFKNAGAMSTTTCNVRGKQSDGLIQKGGPMKATIPISSLLRPLNSAGLGVTSSTQLFSTMSPPIRLISPDNNCSGHRSPGAINCYKSTCDLYLFSSLSKKRKKEKSYLFLASCTFFFLKFSTNSIGKDQCGINLFDYSNR